MGRALEEGQGVLEVAYELMKNETLFRSSPSRQLP